MMQRANQSVGPGQPKSKVPCTDIAPNFPLKVLPREVSDQILALLFPEKAVVTGRMPRVAETISRISLCCRDAQEMTAWYFKEGPGTAIRYRMARYFAGLLLAIGEKPEHVRSTLLQRFSHLEDGGAFPELDSDEEFHLRTKSIFLNDPSPVSFDMVDHRQLEIHGSAVVNRGQDLTELAQAVISSSGEVDLIVQAGCPLRWPDGTPLYRAWNDRWDDFSILAGPDLKWRGEIRFKGVGAVSVLRALLPRFSQHDWHVEWRNGLVVAGSGDGLPQTSLLSMTWTRPSPVVQTEGGSTLHFDRVDWRYAQPAFTRRLVFDSVSLGLGGDSIKSGVHTLIWDGRRCGVQLDFSMLSQLPQLHTAVITLGDPNRAWDAFNPSHPPQMIVALMSMRQLRHLHLSIWAGVRDDVFRGLAQCNPCLSSLTLDLPLFSLESPAAWELLYSKQALTQLTLTNLVAPPAPEQLRDFLVARPGLQALRLHWQGVPDEKWLQTMAPALAAHPGLRLIEIHGASLDRLVDLFMQSPRHDMELCDGANVAIVSGGKRIVPPSSQ